MPVRALWPGFQNICGYGLENIFRDGKGDGVIALSFWKAQIPLTEREVIERDPADLNRAQTQKVGQMNNRIGSNLHRGGESKRGKEFLDFFGSQELGWFLLGKLPGSDKQRCKVFFDDPLVMIQILQEAAKVRAVDPEGGLLYLELCHECIKVFNLQRGKLNFNPFEVLMKTDQKTSYLSAGVVRHL